MHSINRYMNRPRLDTGINSMLLMLEVCEKKKAVTLDH